MAVELSVAPSVRRDGAVGLAPPHSMAHRAVSPAHTMSRSQRRRPPAVRASRSHLRPRSTGIGQRWPRVIWRRFGPAPPATARTAVGEPQQQVDADQEGAHQCEADRELEHRQVRAGLVGAVKQGIARLRYTSGDAHSGVKHSRPSSPRKTSSRSAHGNPKLSRPGSPEVRIRGRDHPKPVRRRSCRRPERWSAGRL